MRVGISPQVCVCSKFEPEALRHLAFSSDVQCAGKPFHGYVNALFNQVVSIAFFYLYYTQTTLK